jgi:RHS repeat-associated protein
VQFTYGYDANDNPTSRVDRIAGIQVGSIARTFDNQNRLASIRQNTGGTVTRRVDFEYDRSGLFQSLTRYRDSTGQQQVARTTYRYDAAARVEQINHAAIDRVLATYDYTRDAAGRITRIMSPDGTADFSYDATGQLISANHSAQEDEFYSYDLNGNRTMTGYRTGLNNRLESDGRYNYFYDDNGNRTLRVEIATGQRTEYLWDHRNRITSVVLKNSLGFVQSEILYTYDVFDRRIRKSIDADGLGSGLTTIKQYAHDGRHIAYELDGVGNITHRLLHGPVTDMVLADQTADGVVHWMLSDHLGTVRDIINNAGIITNHIRYNSFGNIQSQTNTALTPNFAFTGREWDAETGLYQYRARYYDATVGQFASEDPLGLADDLNMARYVRNDPIRRLDPSGTQSDCSENLSQNTNPPGPLPVSSSDFNPQGFRLGHDGPLLELGPDGLIREKFDPYDPRNNQATNTTGCPDDNCDGRLG